MQIPEEYTFLLKLSDEQLTERVTARRDDYALALAVLQERQHQDRVFLRAADQEGQTADEVIKVRQRILRRRRMLRTLDRLFTPRAVYRRSLGWLTKW